MMTPATIQAMLHSALQLHQAGRLPQAESVLRQALAQEPHNPEALVNLGRVLRDMGRLDEAIAAYRGAIQLRPDFPEAHNNLGVALRNSGQLQEAIAAYHRAVQIRPDFAGAWNNLGYALRDHGQLDEAVAACRKAIDLQPDLAEAHSNLAMMLLLKGDLAQGWAEYEWRWQCKGFASPRLDFPQPRWKGSDPTGRSILLHAEQGFGDTIQFIRYAPLLARRGARADPVRVIVECQPELKSLLRGVEGVEHVLAKGEPLPAFDLHAPLLSLPLAFGTTLQNIPVETPYVRPDAALVRAWGDRTAEGGCATLKVGLAWAGSPTRKDDRYRSLSLSALAPLGEVKGITFYSLQKGPPAEQAKDPPPGMKLIDLTDELRDFSDTAALIANLDLVISVDTAVAHLAAAMAKPTWVLLESVPAWRWLLHREDSPWYPTMRLFRQEKRGEWGSVVERVGEELKRKA